MKAMERRNEIWIVWECTPNYDFTMICYSEQEAIEHVRLRKTSIMNTEMEGREIYYQKYVRLE